jgi:hypothetical protein
LSLSSKAAGPQTLLLKSQLAKSKQQILFILTLQTWGKLTKNYGDCLGVFIRRFAKFFVPHLALPLFHGIGPICGSEDINIRISHQNQLVVTVPVPYFFPDEEKSA